jgi:hypothetical protein
MSLFIRLTPKNLRAYRSVIYQLFCVQIFYRFEMSLNSCSYLVRFTIFGGNMQVQVLFLPCLHGLGDGDCPLILTLNFYAMSTTKEKTADQNLLDAPQDYAKTLQELFLGWVTSEAGESAGAKERQRITDDYRDLMDFLHGLKDD